ncbi:LysR family transcriptional regulator [Variovorax paradoxus]|nr:LysR family transcriptional regulator [Variovorax paradoxus]MBT2305230.1 LysR family transcriptional regulator [Variovorax paradoxus]
MDELAAFRVFAKVAQTGSFSKVGRLLGMSTSSIARLVNSLEDELGVRLLNRTTRQLVLTEAGQRFFADASRILQSVDEAKRGATAYQQGVRGVIRVHAGTSVGSGVIIPALPAFLEKHPEIVVDLSLTDERVDIVAEKVDVAVWRGRLDDSGLIARPLASPGRVVCGSPAYFARHGTPSVPADLTRHNCLLYSALHYSSEWTFLREGETINVAVSGNLKADTGGVLLSSTLRGLGLSILPEWLVHEACMRGELQTVLTGYEVRLSDNDPSLYLVYPHRSPPPKVAAFIQFVLGLFQRNEKAEVP